VEITRPDEKTILLTAINPVVTELLRRITPSADPTGSEAAKSRIFSPPTQDLEERPFTADWREYIEPELAKLFQSALQVIEGDLRKLRMDAKTGEATMTIASDHLESWIHGLNQARLVLSERHKLHEEDPDRPPLLAADPRSFILLQMHVYADLQFLFLRMLEGR
jgi:hypothetical protein